MSESKSYDVRATARARERECAIEAAAFKERLRLLGWTNWITIVVPALLSGFAGASIFAGADWENWTGGAALLSALLVAIHKGRNCDAYQAECRRLIQIYSGLGARYRTLHEVTLDRAAEKLVELEAALAATRETANADVPDQYRIDAATLIDAVPNVKPA